MIENKVYTNLYDDNGDYLGELIHSNRMYSWKAVDDRWRDLSPQEMAMILNDYFSSKDKKVKKEVV